MYCFNTSVSSYRLIQSHTAHNPANAVARDTKHSAEQTLSFMCQNSQTLSTSGPIVFQLGLCGRVTHALG